jgi:hypothetical protein
MCEAHYMRVLRHGTTASLQERLAERIQQSGGYVLRKAPGHPRSLGLARAYEHRIVFYDAHGEGPFKCNWCGAEVTWRTMHVDHLDDVKTNNDVLNLVASCAVCNQKRGREKQKKTVRERRGILYDGQLLTKREWAIKLGISWVALDWRLANGWPLDRALTAPRGKSGPKSVSQK